MLLTSVSMRISALRNVCSFTYLLFPYILHSKRMPFVSLHEQRPKTKDLNHPSKNGPIPPFSCAWTLRGRDDKRCPFSAWGLGFGWAFVTLSPINLQAVCAGCSLFVWSCSTQSFCFWNEKHGVVHSRVQVWQYKAMNKLEPCPGGHD